MKEQDKKRIIILYTQSTAVFEFHEVFPDTKIIKVMDKKSLARSFALNKNIYFCLIVLPQINNDFSLFLESLNKSFPLLPVCIITEKQAENRISQYTYINGIIQDTNVIEQIKQFIISIKNTERRKYNRLNWPLKGSLKLSEDTWKDYAVHSISAGGALLKTKKLPALVNTNGTVKIEFQNFIINSECIIVDIRQQSGDLPFGIAIMFTSLSDEAVNIIDKIINDTLIKSLLKEETELNLSTEITQSSIPDDIEFI